MLKILVIAVIRKNWSAGIALVAGSAIINLYQEEKKP